MNEQKKISGKPKLIDGLIPRDFLQYLFFVLLGTMLIVSIPYNLEVFTNIFILIVVFAVSQIRQNLNFSI